MNKIYKLVWNAATGCWSVASEFARRGKSGRVSKVIATSAILVITNSSAAVDDILTNETVISVQSTSNGIVRGLVSPKENGYYSDIINADSGIIIAVSEKNEATGVYAESNGKPISISNKGNIGAASQYSAAKGVHVHLQEKSQTSSINIENSGEILTGSSATNSAGIAVTNLTSGTHQVRIINNGKISLLGGETARSDNSAGILFTEATNADSLNTTLSFVNRENGEVDADENSSGVLLSANDSSMTTVSVENYGILKAGTALLFRGGDDSFTQHKGLTEGNLYMGDGFNFITLDGGTLTGNITTGAGDDFILL
ncbi:ESPR domain-containing protein, partial [Escherichia coli]|nr:hypothetical protein [Escherichia coli]EHL9142142.1 ESPR domain-containing protein [Escherichia coli]EIB8376285.1 ESPR domain-containing protein [Escherichia coli]EKN4252401.1 ESPR domain-containing protein [Escherichia coli]ELE8699409.1 ESPR domain-containing protein [Escherichia coli]